MGSIQLLIGAEKTGLFPVLSEKYGDLGIYETTLGSRLLLGGTSPLIRCKGLVLMEEVHNLQVAEHEVQAPVLVLNVSKLCHGLNAMLGQKTLCGKKEGLTSDILKGESMRVEPPGHCKQHINANCPDCSFKVRMQRD